MLGRRRRQRANINPTLGQCVVFSELVGLIDEIIKWYRARQTAVTTFSTSEQLLLSAGQNSRWVGPIYSLNELLTNKTARLSTSIHNSGAAVFTRTPEYTVTPESPRHRANVDDAGSKLKSCCAIVCTTKWSSIVTGTINNTGLNERRGCTTWTESGQ